NEVVLGIRTIGVGEGLEEDRLVIDELGTAGDEEWRSIGGEPDVGRCAGGELRHRPTLAPCEIEHHDLDGFLTTGPRPEIRVGDPTAARAEEYRRVEDARPIQPVEEVLRELRPDADARVAARRAEATRWLGAVGAEEAGPSLRA